MTHIKQYRIPFLLLALLAVLAAMFLLAGPAAAREWVDNDGQTPFYARFGEGEIFSDGATTVIVFYRNPNCIPADFNLMQFFHVPEAFNCQPTTTDGFELWEEGEGEGPGPKQVKLWGRGAVPVWFVDSAVLQSEINDGEITIGELAALGPIVGAATFYNETLHPGQTNETPLVNIKAMGTLDGGGTFKVSINYVNGAGKTKIDLNQ